ncbi:hypothetical protein JHL17_18450 [Azospirillum sp. YIM B02556]|uniref:Uncharacterized protein n=1 Tax=Azospirillum endophyticum TaxID=2800326 RepID=A0ABS1F7I4_9PROT|nr:hypothetical protein [Azospirillum endophyticum]MBK1839393.1 hypothetical protein [Azospirillum endophyticum]
MNMAIVEQGDDGMAEAPKYRTNRSSAPKKISTCRYFAKFPYTMRKYSTLRVSLMFPCFVQKTAPEAMPSGGLATTAFSRCAPAGGFSEAEPFQAPPFQPAPGAPSLGDGHPHRMRDMIS